MRPKSLIQISQSLEKIPAILQNISRTPVLRWLYLLESAPPPVAKVALSFASGLMDPYFVGKGVKVEEWSPNQVGLFLPDRRWTKGIHGEIPSSVIMSLATVTFRLYWEWQLGAGGNRVLIQEVNWRRTANPFGALRTRYEVPSVDRDQILFQVQSQGRSDFTARINGLSDSGQLIGEIEIQARLEGPKALPKGETP